MIGNSLPIKYTLDKDHFTVLTKATGHVSRQDYFAHPENLMKDPSIPKPWRELVDMSTVKSAEIGIVEVKKMAFILKDYPISKLAIVIDNSLWFGLGRLFAARAFSNNENMLVTKNISEAEQFLSQEKTTPL